MKPSSEVGFSKRIMGIIGRDNISVGQILEENGKCTFGILLLILALPSALPVPAPGYSVPFGIVLTVLGLQMVLGKRMPWVPQKIKEKRLSLGGKDGIKKKIESFTTFFEKIIHHRLEFIFAGPFYRAHGLLVTLCGLSMMIPLPLTNTVPALGIFLLGIGMTEKDGLLGILGGLVCIAGVCLTTAILIF